MFWRNRIGKYSVCFIVLFIIIYSLFALMIFSIQKNQIIDEMKQELLMMTDEVIGSSVSDPDQLEYSAIARIEQLAHDQAVVMRSSFNRFLIFSSLLFCLLIGLFGVFISKRLSIPLAQMRKSTRKIIAGQYDIKLPMASTDEIGQLAMSFNRMSRQLANQMTTLLQEKEILFSIIGSMKDGVMTMNLDGEIIISNQEAEMFIDHFHYEKGSSNTNQLPTDFEQFFQSVINQATTQNFEIKIQGRDWDIVITPLHRNEKLQGAVAIMRDVTEARQLDQLRETFIANVSHELRTPISLMQGYSEAIIDGVTETVADQRELAQVIHDESERMGRLVNELLDLTRLKSGHLDLNVELHSVADFVNKIAHKFDNRLAKNKLSLKINMPDDVDQLLFDYDRLEQVLTNLIDNAIKHTLEKGELTLGITREDEYVQFELTDSGQGIPAEDLPFIFERFYMADKSRAKTERSKQGTGLGLAIVKQIIEAHKGSIIVQSKLGVGTTFKFTLPLN
ncbi:MAG TPA: cell wall metabolism sensor histidine kinase WalK [Bacilli bacterium]|nr:cell wall metabolism sensor histidine kinase WalK [Bacilli bacterium]